MKFYLSIAAQAIRSTPWSELGWSHIKVLMRVPDPAARQRYAHEAVSQTWSVAALDRQISTLYDQRLLSSQDQDGVRREASALIQGEAQALRDELRDILTKSVGGQSVPLSGTIKP